jgi:hypothetical protein
MASPIAKRARRPMKRILTTDAGLTFLLASLFVLLFVLYPLVEPRSLAGYLLDVIAMLVLISGASTVSDRRGLLFLSIALGVSAFVLHWLVYAFPGRILLMLRIASLMLFLTVVMFAVLYKVLRRGRVTSHRIQGAIAVYLMMGLIWASAYALIFMYDPTSFDLGIAATAPDDVNDIQTSGMGQLVYFSFVTMTTLGYGDITPLSAAASNLAILQALTGQLYLAVILARIVSLTITEPRE